MGIKVKFQDFIESLNNLVCVGKNLLTLLAHSTPLIQSSWSKSIQITQSVSVLFWSLFSESSCWTARILLLIQFDARIRRLWWLSAAVSSFTSNQRLKSMNVKLEIILYYSLVFLIKLFIDTLNFLQNSVLASSNHQWMISSLLTDEHPLRNSAKNISEVSLDETGSINSSSG